MRRGEFLVLAGATAALPVATRAPRPVLDKLNTEITAVLAMPDAKEQILKYGFLPLPNRGLDELKDFVKSEIVRWGKVVHEAGIAASQWGGVVSEIAEGGYEGSVRFDADSGHGALGTST